MALRRLSPAQGRRGLSVLDEWGGSYSFLGITTYYYMSASLDLGFLFYRFYLIGRVCGYYAAGPAFDRK
jgi:hypothetical protein